jgi:hypothetical protein
MRIADCGLRIEEAEMIDGSGAFIDDESAFRNPRSAMERP